jgi:hypothetical protein
MLRVSMWLREVQKRPAAVGLFALRALFQTCEDEVGAAKDTNVAAVATCTNATSWRWVQSFRTISITHGN